MAEKKKLRDGMAKSVFAKAKATDAKGRVADAKAKIAEKRDRMAGNLEDARKRAQELREGQVRPNPLGGIKYTGNIEEDDKAEAAGIRGAVQIARDTMAANMDLGYWVCVVFQSRQQVAEFLAASGWRAYLDSSRVYVDGIRVAADMKIALPGDHRKDTVHDADKKLVDGVGIKPYKPKG